MLVYSSILSSTALDSLLSYRPTLPLSPRLQFNSQLRGVVNLRSDFASIGKGKDRVEMKGQEGGYNSVTETERDVDEADKRIVDSFLPQENADEIEMRTGVAWWNQQHALI